MKDEGHDPNQSPHRSLVVHVWVAKVPDAGTSLLFSVWEHCHPRSIMPQAPGPSPGEGRLGCELPTHLLAPPSGLLVYSPIARETQCEPGQMAAETMMDRVQTLA